MLIIILKQQQDIAALREEMNTIKLQMQGISMVNTNKNINGEMIQVSSKEMDSNGEPLNN